MFLVGSGGPEVVVGGDRGPAFTGPAGGVPVCENAARQADGDGGGARGGALVHEHVT